MAFKKGGFGGRGIASPHGAGSRQFGKKEFTRSPSRNRDDRPKLYSATCAECGRTCDVPFRPNGERPVYCKECFGGKRDDSSYSRPARPERAPREFRREREFHPRAPLADPRFDELKRQVEGMNRKIDALVEMLTARAPAIPAAPTSTESLTKIVKKVAKKAAKSKER